MSAAGAAAFAGVALTGWRAMGWWLGRRNDKRLAASQAGMTRDQFAAALSEHGADTDMRGGLRLDRPLLWPGSGAERA